MGATGETGHTEDAVRIVRGQATEEELAAVMVVLLALRAGGAPERPGGPARRRAGSRLRGPERYRAPRSWQ
ncbi:acyl-CoA carboxylase subunit epsilon [Streptomyces mangrovisoli]|uniref:Acyl-CoA carboxylase subunit epsilon n=1 Tax=Streptomyces mangrovisoli TaxID=1428628 RepID=A0A1J4P066_9ACTN|nr:acyl-CoA carboxylase subunit epsilon [Streptomyces mangrovisoli]OIJ68011.1 hypothetical protein WN71_009370 [Streptomyces mangrovisoli]